jgi:hypothetical protein
MVTAPKKAPPEGLVQRWFGSVLEPSETCLAVARAKRRPFGLLLRIVTWLFQQNWIIGLTDHAILLRQAGALNRPGPRAKRVSFDALSDAAVEKGRAEGKLEFQGAEGGGTYFLIRGPVPLLMRLTMGSGFTPVSDFVDLAQATIPPEKLRSER